MTYKKVIENMVRMSAEEYIEGLFNQNGIPFWFTNSEKPKMSMDYRIEYYVDVTVYRNDTTKTVLNVFGFVDEYGHIKNLIVRQGDRIAWYHSEKFREEAGIKYFVV